MSLEAEQAALCAVSDANYKTSLEALCQLGQDESLPESDIAKEFYTFLSNILDDFNDELKLTKAAPYTEESWLAHLELVFSVRTFYIDVFRTMRRSWAFGPSVNHPAATTAARSQTLACIEKLQSALKEDEALRLAACSPDEHPMVLRLTRRYKLSPAEADLFQLLFMRGATKSRSVKAVLAGGGKTEERELLTDVCSLSTLELEEFLDDKRLHMMDGVILDSMDDYDGKMMRMASEAVSVLLLRPLTTEQRLKLSKTELLSVMDSHKQQQQGEGDGERYLDAPSELADGDDVDRHMANGEEGGGDAAAADVAEPRRKRARVDEPARSPEGLKDLVGSDILSQLQELDKELAQAGGARAGAALAAAGRPGDAAPGRGGGGGPGADEEMATEGAGAAAAGGLPSTSAATAAAAAAEKAESNMNGVGAAGVAGGGGGVPSHRGAASSGVVEDDEGGGARGRGARGAGGGGGGELGQYESSLEYLDDAFQVLALMLRTAKARHKEDMKDLQEDRAWYDSYRPASKVSSIRELRAKLKFAKSRLQERMRVTEGKQREGRAELPRLEALARKLGLDEFEKSVVVMLAGVAISPVVKSIFEADSGDGAFRRSSDSVQVKDILTVHFDSFKDQVLARPYFYKSSRLSVRGVMKLRPAPYTRAGGDLMDQQVELDRRMLDWIVGLDTEMNELVEGSHLYSPKTTMEQVVLPEEQKSVLLSTVDNFARLKRFRARAGLEDTFTYGVGLVVLLCGASGTGKTMTVNALAHHLGKRVLMVDFQSLYSSSAGSRSEDQSNDLRGLFRDADMNDAIIFFDECEAIFAQRERGGDRMLNALLTEMERYEGIIMLATNRPLDLDEAMHRRITYVSEFRAPDHRQRRQIWRVASEKLPTAPAIDWHELALRYELTGGYIKNALFSALLQAIARDGDNPCISQDDVITGCRLQMRGSLQMKSFAQRVVPQSGLDELVLPRPMRAKLDAVVSFERARAVLLGQWGFLHERTGAACLFWGPHGTGKSAAAEALGFELGRPLKVVNCAQLVSSESSTRTGVNISAAFKDARLMDALLVLEDFQVLRDDDEGGGASSAGITSVSAWSKLSLGLLLHELERFPGICILIANNIQGSIAHRLEPELLRRLRFLLEFRTPDQAVRARMWRKLLPLKVPLASDVNFDELGKRFELTSGAISAATLCAAAQAALRGDDDQRVKQKDLIDAAEAERDRVRDDIDDVIMRSFV